MANKNFVVKNGLEVNTNLVFADSLTDRVGIATTNPRHTLHVTGGIGATHLTVVGVTTVSSIRIDGRLSAGSSLGSSGQYLTSTGTGVTWKSVASPRVSTVYTANIGDTSFPVTYTVGLVDVYVNGIRLAPTEFTATNGTSVNILDPCFGGETIELVVYNSL